MKQWARAVTENKPYRARGAVGSGNKESEGQTHRARLRIEVWLQTKDYKIIPAAVQILQYVNK